MKKNLFTPTLLAAAIALTGCNVVVDTSQNATAVTTTPTGTQSCDAPTKISANISATVNSSDTVNLDDQFNGYNVANLSYEISTSDESVSGSIEAGALVFIDSSNGTAVIKAFGYSESSEGCDAEVIFEGTLTVTVINDSIIIEPTITMTPTSVVTATMTQAPTAIITATEQPTSVVTTTMTQAPTATMTATEQPTSEVTATMTQAPTAIITATEKPTSVVTTTITQAPTAIITATEQPTSVVTTTMTQAPTAIITATEKPTSAITATMTQVPTATITATEQPTSLVTATMTQTPTATVTATMTATATNTATPTMILTPTTAPSITTTTVPTGVLVEVPTTTLVPSMVGGCQGADYSTAFGSIDINDFIVTDGNHQWQCISGQAGYPSLSHCNNAAYEMGGTYSDLAWEDQGMCSEGTITMVPSPTTTMTVTVTPEPTTRPTAESGVWCPMDDSWKAEPYAPGKQVIYDGRLYEAGPWTSATDVPVEGGTGSGWQSPWKDLGALELDWCDGKAVTSTGRDLKMAGWPAPIKRQWLDYDQSSGKQVGAYYAEWGIYARKFNPQDIPFHSLTHIYYAFLTVCGDNSTAFNEAAANDGFCEQEFEVNTYDEYAAVEINSLSQNDAEYGGLDPNVMAGLFGEFTRAKVAHPHVKIMASVGGWTLSRPFYEMAATAENRQIFAKSVQKFLRTYITSFDGVDIDWEFPGGQGNDPDMGCADMEIDCYNPERDADGANFVLLMKDLREALDELEFETGKYFELSAAMSADPKKLDYIPWDQAAVYMDGINLMTYDLYGAWDNETLGHQTSMYFERDITKDDGSTVVRDWNTDTAVKTIQKYGVASHKINVGVAMYGRGWTGVDGFENNDPFTGTATGTFPEGIQECPDTGCKTTSYSGGGIAVGTIGQWEKGIADYAYIEQEWMGGADGTGTNGFEYHYDASIGAAWMWNPSNGQLVTMDSKESTLDKGQYVLDNDLGGVFAWEIDADSGTILNAMNEGVGNKKQ
jgi:GH18 family chitinase